MSTSSKRRWMKASLIGPITLLMIAIGIFIFFLTRDPSDIRSFLKLRYKWDRTAVGQSEEEFAEQCLELAKNYPDTTGELSALYLAACRAPKTEPGQKARERFIAHIADADLGRLGAAIDYSHHAPSVNALTDTRPDPRVVGHYYSLYRDHQGIAAALLDRLKRSPNDSHTAALLGWVCRMSQSDQGKPNAQFAEAADLIASHYADSPDILIFNFCEIVGNMSPSWAGRYERHLLAILKANQDRSVRCAAQFALASLVEWSGETRQAEAEKLYNQFLENFDGQYQYPFQGIEQRYCAQATNAIVGLRLCGIGKTAPEIVGVDSEGRQMKLSEYRGKVVLLTFWATWCGPCMRLIPHEQALAERLQGKPFAIVGVNGDTEDEAIKKAVATHKITWRSFRDIRANQTPISGEWKVGGWPMRYLIDQKGVVRARWLGDPEEAIDEMNKAIDKLLDAVP